MNTRFLFFAPLGIRASYCITIVSHTLTHDIAGLAVTHMTPLSHVHQMQPAKIPTLHRPHPGSWDNAPAINAFPHASPVYQAGYWQQMFGKSSENVPRTVAGTLPVASVQPSQGRQSHLHPFQLAVNPANPANEEGIHAAYGKYDPHLQMGNHVMTGASTTTQQDFTLRLQTNAPMQYHEEYSHLHPLPTQCPLFHATPQHSSSSNDSEESTTSNGSSKSSEGESDPHNHQRIWVTSDDPEVIQTAAALERILFGDNEVADDKHQYKSVKARSNEVSDTTASYPVHVGGRTEPGNQASDDAAAQVVHESNYKEQHKPQHEIEEPAATGDGQILPSSPSNVTMAAYLQGQDVVIGPTPQQQINTKGLAPVSLSSRSGPMKAKVSGQMKGSVQVPTPVGAAMTRRSIPAVAARVEKGVRKRTQTHPPHSNSRIFNRREFGYSRVTSIESKSNLQQPAVHVPHPQSVHGVEKHVQQPSTRNAPLPSIRGSGDESNSLHQTPASSLTHNRPSTGEGTHTSATVISTSKLLMGTTFSSFTQLMTSLPG